MMSKKIIDKIGILSTQIMFLFCGLNNPIYNVLCVYERGNYGNLIMPRLLSLHLPLACNTSRTIWFMACITTEKVALSLCCNGCKFYTRNDEKVCVVCSNAEFHVSLQNLLKSFIFPKNNNEDLCRIYRKIKVMVEVWKYL